METRHLVFILATAVYCQPLVLCDQCIRNSSSTVITSHHEDPDGFKGLLSAARSFRDSFFSLSPSNDDRLRNDIERM